MTLYLPWLVNLFFISIRVSVILLFTPIQAIRQLPIHVRLFLVFAFSLLINNYLPVSHNTNRVNLVLGGLAECANGLILATSIYASFAVFQIAGQLIDSQTGLNSLALFNPAEHASEPLTSRLLSMLAVLFFFAMDGHIWLFKGLTYSFLTIPPGTLTLLSGFTPVIQQFGFMFSTALMIALPVIIVLLAIDFSGAIITRNMPQVNTYFLTLPIKILLGFFILSLMMDYLAPITNRVFTRCFNVWQASMT